MVGETIQKEQYRGVKSGGVNSRRCDIENHEYSWHTSHDTMNSNYMYMYGNKM